VSAQTVCTGHFTAREKSLDLIELEAGCVLELIWMFWRTDSSIAPAKIWTPYLLAYVLVILLTVLLLDTDLKIIQKSVLMKWNCCGLDVFDSWLDFWKASMDMVISLEVLEKGISCTVSCLTSFHVGNEVTSFKA